MITSEKENYFLKLGQKLSDPANGVKTYWSAPNKTNNRNKVTNISPLLENGVFVTNYQTNVDVLTNYLQNNSPCFLMIVLSLRLPQNVIKFYQMLVLIDRKFFSDSLPGLK